MGCDIHSFAEVKRNGKWEYVNNKPFKNPYYNPEKPNQIDDDGFEWNAEMQNEPYGGRNYDLFAILADVRNGRGFAGIKTSEGFNPIAEPKGLPIDVSEEVKKQYCIEVGEEYELSQIESWVDRGCSEWISYGTLATNPDWHSASWFTVRELKEYDWNQITMKRGTISLNQFIECQKTGLPPNIYSGSVGGSNIITIDEHEAEVMLEKGTIPKGKKVYVNYHWTITYADHCKSFLETTIPALETLGEPDDVRIVFFFDN